MIKMVVSMLALLPAAVLAARGVNPADIALYQGTEFKCRDGSSTVPIAQVNDDYCDCADGSDEPGTSACSQSSYHCVNQGWQALTVPASRVNDGICDCCDGSDEYASMVTCPNACIALAAKESEKHQLFLKKVKQGLEIRQQLLVEAKSTAEDMEVELLDLQEKLDNERAKAEWMAKELAELEKVESAERENQRAEYDTMMAERKAARAAMLGEDVSAPTPIAEEGEEETAVEAAATEEKPADAAPAAATEEGKKVVAEEKPKENFPYPAEYMFDQATKDKEKEKEEEDAAIKEAALAAQIMNEQGGDVDDEGAEYCEEGDEDCEDDSSVVGEGEDKEEEEGEEEFSYNDPEAQKARAELTTQKNLVADLEGKLNEAKELKNQNWGEENVYLTFRDKCFTKEHKEYTYEFCPYKDAAQKQNGGSTNLGSWGGWVEDAAVPTMKFTNGQGCWNGPSRELTVEMTCDSEHVIKSVEETSTCIYLMKFGSPAGCHPKLLEPMGEASVEM